MRVKVEFEIDKLHCLDCPFREQTGWDLCVIQKDENGYFLDFDDWESQMENCPLKLVSEED